MSELSDTIEQFNQLDIQNSHAAFDKWLKSKIAKKSNPVPQSEQESSKGKNAFDSWLSKKKHEAKLLKSRQQQENLIKIEKEKEKLELASKKQKLCNLKFQEWKQQKYVLQKSRKESDQLNTLKKEQILLEKSIKCKKSLENYWKNVEKRPHSSLYPHKTDWVDIIPSEPNACIKITKGNSTDFKYSSNSKSKKSEMIVPSPPGLYKEHDLYVEKAPLFLLKYRNHVASGR
jgi:hypothetical protein